MAAGAFLQGGNGFIGGRVGAVSPAVLDVVKTFGKVAVDKGFWGEGDFSVLHAGLKEVTDSDVGLLANALGNDNLKLSFYGTSSMTCSR